MKCVWSRLRHVAVACASYSAKFMMLVAFIVILGMKNSHLGIFSELMSRGDE